MHKPDLKAGLVFALVAALLASCDGGNGAAKDGSADGKADGKTDATSTDAKDGGADSTGTDATADRTQQDTSPAVDAAVDMAPAVDAQPDSPAAMDVQPDRPADAAVDMAPMADAAPDRTPDMAPADAPVDMPPAPTYTVGGTITGLTGTGLVLRNNGGDNLTVAASATTFTFATRVATGGAYAVTVLTQPSAPTQVCSVTGGTGNVASANVTSVAISCVTQTYAVGGTVTGLAGTGLVLRNTTNNNVATSINATANGSFAFPALPSGASYAVTVQTQPGSPAQVCSVANGSGVVGAAAVTNVAVTCATTTYTVGGNVTGLTGTGLVLRNNGGDDRTVAPNSGAAVPFTFTTPIAAGGAYAVTVQTQPTGQRCTVTGGGTGTVGSANVTNVAVTCVSLYTIGGTVSGLTSGTVTLNFGGPAAGRPPSLTVGANGTYASAAVPTGTDYAVTVETPPTGQTCTIANAMGTVGTANVTNVNVTCVTTPTTFTIGGTVTGATGSVVLDFGTATNAPADVTATGATYASAAVPPGTMYTVTVQTPPAGQTCTVANGTGTVGTANVTNVNVTCTTIPTFTIGGTVTGLTSGMVVLDFGTATGAPADVTRTANGAYASAAVPGGTMYTVTVQTQPAGLTCTVANGTGTVAAANVTNVNVTCAPTSTAEVRCAVGTPPDGATDGVREGAPGVITCPTGKTISAITFAHWGLPTGMCNVNYAADPACDRDFAAALAAAPYNCIGMATCTVEAHFDDAVFGDPCPGPKHMKIQATCQ